ncbi:MAG TPA: hypothetical protein EYO33_31045 [Phycisphaerales bacterium]|nr:hypothetical protein [Phycisphaerales bacterium]
MRGALSLICLLIAWTHLAHPLCHQFEHKHNTRITAGSEFCSFCQATATPQAQYQPILCQRQWTTLVSEERARPGIPAAISLRGRAPPRIS